MSSVGIEFPKEQERLRDLVTRYRSIGPQGEFGARVIEMKLKEAEEAMAGGDIIEILSSFEKMRATQ